MNKKIFFLILVMTIISSCQRHEIKKTHGLAYLEKRQKLIVVNKSNKNDTIEVLGQPATKGMTNDNLWIYIERTKARGKMLKLGRVELRKNNVLVLEFNKFGILNKKEFYDKNNMKKLTFAKNITENDIKKENFIYGFLSSVRSKMESRRK